MTENHHNPDLVPAEQAEQFVNLLMANQNRIYTYILSLVHDPHDADDLLQETSTRLWKQFREFEPGTNFGAWAVAIARYRVLEFRRSNQGRALPMSQDLFETLADDAAQASELIESHTEALGHCLEKLPETERELIRMRYTEGAQVRDIAAARERTPQAVYKSISRIHSTLLACIQRALAEESRR